MAQGADGSIVIDTELDNSGFDKGSEKLQGSIERLLKSVNGVSSDVTKATTQSLTVLQQIASNTSSIYQAITERSDEAVTAGQRVSATHREMAESAGAVTQSVQQEGQAIKSMAGTATSNVSSLEKEINTLSSSMAGISRSAEAGFSNAKAVLSFDSKLSAISEKLETAKAKVEAFGNTKIPTEDYAWLQQAISKAEAQLDKYIEKEIQMDNSGVSRRSARWKNLQAQIEQTKQMLETYKGELADLENTGEAFTLGSNTQQYAQMLSALQRTESELARNKALIDSEAIAQARLNVLTAQEQVAVAQTAEQRKRALAQLQEAQAKLSEVAAASSNKLSPSEGSTSGWKALGSVVKNVGKAAVTTAGRLAKMGFHAVASGAKKAVKGMKEFCSQSGKASLSAKALAKQLLSLKNMMIGRIKRMFISSIFEQARNGIHSLAQYSAAFNKSMSDIKNSATQLGGNLAVAFGNLVNAMAPAITAIINMLSTAISYVNAFFALLSGKKTMTVAKKGTDDYAQSVGGAAAAQKELNRQVYGFDELNKRNKESNSGGGGGTGGVEYEEVPIDDTLPDSIKKWFERIKEAFEKGDWYGIGTIIAEGLNAAMQVADDWINNVFRPMGVLWASRVAQVLNGLVDGFDWNLMGKTFADGLNSVFDIANTFLTTFNFENLGNGIGTAINGFFKNTDWSLIGQTIANGIMAAVNLAFGAISVTDFLVIGSSIAELLNSAITQADFKRIGETIGAGLRGAIQTAFGFIENIDFDSISAKIKEAAQACLNKMNEVDPRTGLNGWQELGTAMADLANGIVQAFESIPWGDVAKGIGETLSTFLSKADIEVKLVLGALLINGIAKVIFGKGVLALVGKSLGKSIVSNLSTSWPSLGAGIKGAISSLGSSIAAFATTDVLAASAGQIGAAILGGLFIGGEIGKLIDNHVIGPLIEALGGDQVTAELYKNFHWFGAGGFFDQMWSENDTFLGNVQIWCDALGMMFSDAWGGIKSAASAGWSAISGAVSSAWSTVTSGVSSVASSIGTTLSTTWTNIKTGASTAWSGIKSTVTSLFTNAKTSLSSTATAIKTDVSNAWANVKSNTSTAWTNIKSSIVSSFTNAKTSLASTASNIKTSLASTWSSVKSTATQTWSNIKSSVSSSFTSLKSSISSTASGIKTVASNAWSSIQSTASSKWSSITSTVSSKWSNLKSILKAQDWTSIGSNLVNGLKNGISNAWSSLTSKVSSLCSGLTSKVKSAFGIHSPSKVFAEIGAFLDSGMIQGIEQGKAKLLNTASNLASAVTDGLTPGSPEIELTANTAFAGISLVIDKLADIASTFKGIADMLSNLDLPNGTLPIPQIATGTLVPPATKVSGETDNSNQTDFEAMRALVDLLDERLADISYKQETLISIVKRLNLNIDIDALTRAITQRKRETELNFGGV